MATKREQIITALKTSLESIGSTPVFRSRPEPVSRGKTPAITIEGGKDVAGSTVIQKTDWAFLVHISVITRGDIPDQIADPIIESIHNKIMEDQTIGGLAMNVEPVEYDPMILEADKPAGIFANTFLVSYRTNEKDLTQ